jgi:hypothetical protein
MSPNQLKKWEQIIQWPRERILCVLRLILEGEPICGLDPPELNLAFEQFPFLHQVSSHTSSPHSVLKLSAV